MREILFRGKHQEKGWVYGDLTQLGEIRYITADMDFPNLVEKDSVGQYTGLTDKNKAKIFEGDLLEDERGVVWLMTYATGWWSYQLVSQKAKKKEYCSIYPWTDKDKNNYLPGLKIIGNAYDNPELLEVDE